jgi:hypothetical protein
LQVHIRQQVQPQKVPEELLLGAFSYLEAAEQLNSVLLEKPDASSFYRGQVILWLSFHASELILKASILRVAPAEKATGHSLRRLTQKLRSLRPDAVFEPPFQKQALPPYPDLVRKAERESDLVGEALRYATNNSGIPWLGPRGFSPDLFAKTLQRLG